VLKKKKSWNPGFILIGGQYFPPIIFVDFISYHARRGTLFCSPVLQGKLLCSSSSSSCCHKAKQRTKKTEKKKKKREREGKNKGRMQALVAAMAAHALSLSALAPPSTATASSAVLQSSFSGITVRVSNAPFLASVSAVKRPLTVLAVTKKAVAVLKGNSAVEGVVQLFQEDDGMIIF
jgi:hypothetical protein